MNPTIKLYDSSTIDTLPWPNSEIAHLTKTYWVAIMKAGSSTFVSNVNTQMFALLIDDLVLPVTVNDRELENSYVCSFYNHYITYCKEELINLKNPPLERVLETIINYLGNLTIWGGMNKVVIVHNFLLSTNLYPDLSNKQIAIITQHLKEIFTHHALIFRSINTFITDELYKNFQDNNYSLIGSRQIYLFNPKEQDAMRTKMRWRLKQDSQLIEKQGYEVIEQNQLSIIDIPRIIELYNLLYLKKYSDHNPQFTEKFIELTLSSSNWKFKALKKAGKIDGVIGFYTINGVMTTPILGYDTSLPQEIGLYRMLSVLLTIEANKKGIILHQSSGAASFKRFRGFIDNIEYSAVYYQHLPKPRKLIWLILEFLVNRIAVPLMKKYKL